jgi:hypothetical protein
LGDDVSRHLRVVSHTGELEPITETGRFHVQVLQLKVPISTEPVCSGTERQMFRRAYRAGCPKSPRR